MISFISLRLYFICQKMPNVLGSSTVANSLLLCYFFTSTKFVLEWYLVLNCVTEVARLLKGFRLLYKHPGFPASLKILGAVDECCWGLRPYANLNHRKQRLDCDPESLSDLLTAVIYSTDGISKLNQSSCFKTNTVCVLQQYLISIQQCKHLIVTYCFPVRHCPVLVRCHQSV